MKNVMQEDQKERLQEEQHTWYEVRAEEEQITGCVQQQYNSRKCQSGDGTADKKRRTKPPTHDACYTQQYSCSTAADALAQSCVVYTGISHFHFFWIPRHSRERAIRHREGLSTPPARQAGHERPFFRRDHRGLLCVGRAWRQPENAGGQVALGSRSCFLGMLEQNIFEDPFGHHPHYYRGALYDNDGLIKYDS